MPYRNLLVLLLVCPLVLFLVGSTSSNAFASPIPPDARGVSVPQGPDVPQPPPPPESEHPRTHTLTIYNGDKVLQQTYIWRNGSWQTCGDCNEYDVFVRDCPRSPWHCYGTYHSRHCAEQAAYRLRANGNLASVRHHCD